MGVPLFVINLPTYDRDPLRVLLSRVQHDCAACTSYKDEFDPKPPNRSPSPTASTYETAESRLGSLKGLLRNLADAYATEEQKPALQVILRDEKVKKEWKKLRKEIDRALRKIDSLVLRKYNRTDVWAAMRDVVVIYQVLIVRLEQKIRGEPIP